METEIKIYKHSSELPEIACGNYFHSDSLFRVYEQTSGHTPYMLTAEDAGGNIVAHLLAVVRQRGSWVPPYFFTQCRIYGEGEYDDSFDDNRRHELFDLMISRLTKKIASKCLYVEISNISEKMFGYKSLRENGYFPVHWMEVHNSLHSMDPDERITDEKMTARLKKAIENGVMTKVAETEEELKQYYKMCHAFYRSRLRRFSPPESFFESLWKDKENAKILLTKYKDKIIGGSTIVFSRGNAYLWYAAYRPKSYPRKYPSGVTVRYALKYCYEHNYSHLYFMDVGLPYHNNGLREFILSFGGKPVGTNRWFRCSIRWINKLLSWIWES